MHFPPKFLHPPTFSMVHLLHRLYGVDAPGDDSWPNLETVTFLRDVIIMLNKDVYIKRM